MCNLYYVHIIFTQKKIKINICFTVHKIILKFQQSEINDHW